MFFKQMGLLCSAVILTCASASVLGTNDQLTLIQTIKQVNAIHCDFSQSTLDNEGDVLQAFNGELAYQRPDHFYWHAEEPMAQKIVSDGQKIWHLDEDLEQLIIQSYKDQADQALLLSVLQKPDSLFETYKIKSVTKSGTKASYNLQPKKKPAALNALSLQFEGGKLRAFNFEDALSQKTQIKLLACDKYKAMPLFTIDAPKDFDVIYE